MKEIKTIYQYLFYALVFTVPFEDDIRAVPNIILIMLLVFIPFIGDFKLNRFWYFKTYRYLLILVIAILTTSLVFSTIREDLFVIKKSLLLIPFLVFTIPIRNIKNMTLAFILAIALGNIVSLFGIIGHVLESGSFQISTGNKINEILFIERLYFGFVNSISIACTLILLPKSNIKLKSLLIANIAMCVILVFIVASRMAIITILLIGLVKLAYHSNLKKALLTIGFGLVLIIIMFSINDNLSNRFIYSNRQSDLAHKIREWEPRFVIWKCGINLIQNHDHGLLFGDGFYNTQQNLNSCYKNSITKERRLKYFLETRFNTHNQYLDFLLSKGFFGLAIFLILLYYLALKNKRDINRLNLLLVLILFCLIENVFHRQLGIYLLGFIVVILTKNNEEYKIANE